MKFFNKKAIGCLSLLLFSGQIINASKGCGTNENCEVKCDSAKDKCGSRSFFRDRPVIFDYALYDANNEYFHHRAYFEPNSQRDVEGQMIHVSRGAFYQQSINSDEKELARYFLPGNKSCVSVAEDGTGDIGSLWFNVMAPVGSVYKSTLCFRPERMAFGAYFNYRQFMECVDGLWLNVKFAVYETRHHLHPKETLANPEITGTLPNARTVLEYMSSDELKFGRLSKCELKAKGFDDIEVKLGYDFSRCPENGYYAGLYSALIMPLSPKPKARYLFEPVVGYGCWGLGVGFNAGYLAWCRDNQSLALMTDIAYEYIFRDTELRSFDFKRNGQWSRYLRLARESDPTVSFPAINFTTLPVKVEPRGMLNLWIGAHYQVCSWHIEAGYNLWWRQSEKICLDDKCNNFDSLRLGIFGLGNACNPTTASNANISQGLTSTGSGNVVVNDATFVPVKLADLDLASASHPEVLTNKVYGTVTKDICFFCRPINIGVGAGVEFTKNFKAIEQWTIWGNFETSF